VALVVVAMVSMAVAKVIRLPSAAIVGLLIGGAAVSMSGAAQIAIPDWLAELSLMTTEKTEALAASAAALSVRAAAVGERLGQAALDEGARAMQAATEIACALTPAAAAQAQFRYALGWWSRAAGQTLTLSAELTQAQTAALTPIHKTAVANAKRRRKR